MKKPYFVFIFFIICGFSIFGNNNNQEEVDFLLFMPNSGNRFVNEEQAFNQLNNLARYLLNKNLNPGQIIIYGYAASAPNDIKPADLSKERALTVIEELKKRGVSKELFADPVGCGAVYLWGGNANENDRKLNRRVRVLLDRESPIPVTQEVITAEIESPKAEVINPVVVQKATIVPEYQPKKSNFRFPWWLLPVLALIFLLLLLHREWFRESPRKKETANAEPPVSQTDTLSAFAAVPAPESGAEFIPSEAVTTWTVNLDDEIRSRAYEFSLQRNEQGDYREQDWYRAVHEISTWYAACGHTVYIDGGCWWASRSYSW